MFGPGNSPSRYIHNQNFLKIFRFGFYQIFFSALGALFKPWDLSNESLWSIDDFKKGLDQKESKMGPPWPFVGMLSTEPSNSAIYIGGWS